MNKILIVLALTANALTCEAAAQVCSGLDDYVVQKVSFSDVSLQTGLGLLTTGMPYQTIVTGGTDLKVSATDVSGNLDAVLDKFSKEAGFTYKQDKCVIQVAVIVPKLKWQINKGDNIPDKLTQWGKANGVAVSWEAQELEAEANVAVTGTFYEAVTAIIDGLNSSGQHLHPTLYEFENNKALRITERK